MRPFATLAAFFAAVLAGRFAFAAFFAVRFLVAMVCSWVKDRRCGPGATPASGGVLASPVSGSVTHSHGAFGDFHPFPACLLSTPPQRSGLSARAWTGLAALLGSGVGDTGAEMGFWRQSLVGLFGEKR